MNRALLVGNSGADAEVKMSKGGKPYCKFSLATSEKNADNTFSSTWHTVMMFGRVAETQGPLIKKGSKVYVEGKITYNEFTDKNEVKRTSTSIMAFTVMVAQKEAKPADAYAQGGQTVDAGSIEFSDQDIPF